MFTEIIYRPLLNLTVFLYATIGFADLGIAIIAVTILTRLVMLPLSLKTARSQRAMASLAPEIERIKERLKGDMNAQSAEVMKLYKERGVSPLSGCLPLLIQFPILIGLYRVFLNLFKPETLSLLYTFVPHPATLNTTAFGFLDISVPSHILAVLAGAAQFAQAKLTGAAQQTGQAAAMNRQMVYLLPLMIVVIGWNLPAGLSLYWVATTLVSIGEQLYLRRSSGILAP
jgi:YidC/Oxa1 family membrane protein insertase